MLQDAAVTYLCRFRQYLGTHTAPKSYGAATRASHCRCGHAAPEFETVKVFVRQTNLATVRRSCRPPSGDRKKCSRCAHTVSYVKAFDRIAIVVRNVEHVLVFTPEVAGEYAMVCVQSTSAAGTKCRTASTAGTWVRAAFE